MAIVIVLALTVPLALVLVGVLGILPAIAAEIAILFVAAWAFDRRRRLGARDPYLDANRPDIGAGTIGDTVVVTSVSAVRPGSGGPEDLD